MVKTYKEKYDPYISPTLIINQQLKQNPNSKVSYSTQLRESFEERTLQKHKNYQEKWDNYEQ